MTFKKKWFFSAVIVSACVVVIGILFWDHPEWFGIKSNCLVLKDGIVNVEVTFPSQFVVRSDFGSIRVYKKDDLERYKDNAMYVLAIDSHYYSSLTSVIWGSSRDPGPIFATSTFNGHVAAFGQVIGKEDKNWVRDYYEIPFGNRNISLDLDHLILSGDYRIYAEKMLASIKISTTTEDIKTPLIESCGSGI